MKQTELVPIRCLCQAEGRYPGSFRALSRRWAAAGSKVPPFSDAVMMIGQSNYCSAAEAVGEGAFLYACAGWSAFKKVYVFDESLAGSLASQADGLSDTDVLPAQILERLPYPCFYVASPDITANGYDGFFTWLEYGRQESQLRFLFLSGDGLDFLPCGVDLKLQEPLGDCFPNAED